jgi:hypothetical protein
VGSSKTVRTGALLTPIATQTSKNHRTKELETWEKPGVGGWIRVLEDATSEIQVCAPTAHSRTPKRRRG